MASLALAGSAEGVCWICRRSEWSVQGCHVTDGQGYQGLRDARHGLDQTSNNEQLN
jgi:hypothetical protein